MATPLPSRGVWRGLYFRAEPSEYFSALAWLVSVASLQRESLSFGGRRPLHRLDFGVDFLSQVYLCSSIGPTNRDSLGLFPNYSAQQGAEHDAGTSNDKADLACRLAVVCHPEETWFGCHSRWLCAMRAQILYAFNAAERCFYCRELPSGKV